MPAPFPRLLLFFFVNFLIQNPFLSNANLQKTRLLISKSLTHQTPSKPDHPTTFFQVTKPLKTPKTTPCSVPILRHSFSSTVGQSPVTAPYRPPSNCPSQTFSQISLHLSAACKGRQFDRIFGIWVGGVEILRSCTAEPRRSGIVWTVDKDITRYASLFRRPQVVAFYLGNIVDETYTGIYHVNLTFVFYPEKTKVGISAANQVKSETGFGSPADLILPISRNLPLKDGMWFLIENSTDIQFKDFRIPRNAYRAVLEVFVSFHSTDESWYSNPPNDYIIANNLTGIPGNGAFREVVVSLDGKVVGAVWPFTVIYTGGVNPLLWRPITGIGSFDLPSYDIEITPFLGSILDGKHHRFAFGVTNGLSVWFVDANLHLWLDGRSARTKGRLIKHEAAPFKPFVVSRFKGLNGSFVTRSGRLVSSTGWVRSSHGKITTHSFQALDYINSMIFKDNGDLQIVNQTIESTYGVYAKFPSSEMYSVQVFQRFPLYLYSHTVSKGNNSFYSSVNVSLGFNEERYSGAKFGFSFSSLRNSQDGNGYMLVKGNLVMSGLGSAHQKYEYDSTDGCYFRQVTSRNYTILHDESGELCTK
ncbi:Peptide-N4-(N-acetyl-beta-glucosaminyl)asparagine amidase A [Asimina triloba]